MTALSSLQAVLGRLLAALLLVLAVTVLWQVRPWNPDPVALRPDTGTAARNLDEDALSAVLIELLDRVYTAFGQESEGAIYDGLALAVSDDLLTDLYLQRRAAQEAELEEGGTTEIRAVELNEMTVLARTRTGYVIDADWTVTGEVGHVDHRHERVNRYAARLTLGPADREWRLTAFDLNRIERQAQPLVFSEEFQLNFGDGQ